MQGFYFSVFTFEQRYDMSVDQVTRNVTGQLIPLTVLMIFFMGLVIYMICVRDRTCCDQIPPTRPNRRIRPVEMDVIDDSTSEAIVVEV